MKPIEHIDKCPTVGRKIHSYLSTEEFPKPEEIDGWVDVTHYHCSDCGSMLAHDVLHGSFYCYVCEQKNKK